MGNSSSATGWGSFAKPAPAPQPILSYPSGTNVYSVPVNSGSIDIDIPNLQRCILQGGGSSCVNFYVQGYDTTNNSFVPTQYVPNQYAQGFAQLEGSSDFTTSNIVLIIVVILALIVAFKY
jgi:hypothetical protein